MTLLEMYRKIQAKIEGIPFGELWDGFHPFPFAVYDESYACLDGKMIDRPQEFIANTAMEYQGRMVAIFRCKGTEDVETMTSKMAHEMFHAFQNEQHESRFPDELDALVRYEYSPDNLSFKRKENRLLAEMAAQGFRETKWDVFLSLRKNRWVRFPDSLTYESQIEQIEGTANYIELSVLRHLNLEKYEKKLHDMCRNIVDADALFPIRIGLYDSGALLIRVIKENGIPFSETFGDHPFSLDLLEGVGFHEISVMDEEMTGAIRRYFSQIDALISRISAGKPLAEGEFDLLGVNVYNAKFYRGYIYTTYFLMFRDHEREHTLFGNYLIRMREGKIVQIFKDVEETT